MNKKAASKIQSTANGQGTGRTQHPQTSSRSHNFLNPSLPVTHSLFRIEAYCNQSFVCVTEANFVSRRRY